MDIESILKRNSATVKLCKISEFIMNHPFSDIYTDDFCDYLKATNCSIDIEEVKHLSEKHYNINIVLCFRESLNDLTLCDFIIDYYEKVIR